MGWVSALIRQRAFRVWGLATLLLVSAVALAGGIALGSPNCTNSLSGSTFEIDPSANLKVDNPASCIDWLTDGAGSGLRTTAAPGDGSQAQNDKPSGASDDSFGTGTAEDNPNPTIVDGSIPPNKSDLKAFGVYTETGTPTTDNPSGKFLELFWSRVQNPSGTTNMDFELNQKLCDGTATNCANNGTAKAPKYVTPKRTTGDKLITYDLSKGGTVPTISIRTWTAAGAWGSPTVISGGTNPEALGSVNTSFIPANETGGATGGLTTALGSQDPYTFGEAAVSFKALFGENTCGRFGSAYLKSRSSDSFTAEIKDFVAPEPVSVSNCPAVLTTDATDSVTIGSPISDTATLDVPAGTTGTITFRLYGPNDTNCSGTPVTTSTAAVSGPGSYDSAPYTPTVTGTYNWTAQFTSTTAGVDSTGEIGCGDSAELSQVNKAPSSISTAQELRPQDSATLSASAGGTPTGTVDFYLYGPGNPTCSASGPAPVYTELNVPLSGGTASTHNTTFSVTSATSATYHWKAVYDGDATHDGSTSNCTENFTLTIAN